MFTHVVFDILYELPKKYLKLNNLFLQHTSYNMYIT